MTPVPAATADAWDRYLTDVRADCARGDRAALARRVWARLAEGDGPPVNYFQGDEPVSLLAWVLAKLTPQEVGPLGAALFDVLGGQLVDLPDTPPAVRVGSLAAVCDLLKLGQKKVVPPDGAVGRALRTLVTDDGPTPLACRVHAAETPAGQSLLADVLRALAVYTPPGSAAEPWRRLLADPALGRAALPAFLGYCRAAGNQARFGLRHVARALANRRPDPAPDLLAGTIKAFATAAYSDADYDPNAIDLAAADFDGLFAGLPAAFVRDTFANLRKLGFALTLLPVWEAAARATERERVPAGPGRPAPAGDGPAPPRALRGPVPWRIILDPAAPAPVVKATGQRPDRLRLGSGGLTRELNVLCGSAT